MAFMAGFALSVFGSANGATFTVTTTNDSGPGSLRQAIFDSNTNAGENVITFQITPGTNPFIINLASSLPVITNVVTIDGRTQPGYSNMPLVELNGFSAGTTAIGLQFDPSSTGSSVFGLAINRFAKQGIILIGDSNIIQGNHIGTDTTGGINRGNGDLGIWIKSSGNLIGGTNAASRNIISGNGYSGVFLQNGGGNTVQGNWIGLGADGTQSIRNATNGITVFSSQGNLIGGTDVGARNIISGNGGSGIFIHSAASRNNLVQGNFIGLDASGSISASNSIDGITLSQTWTNTIGPANVISGNGEQGIFISASSNSIVHGNIIGLDATGKLARPNRFSGVDITSGRGHQITGTNLISGNLNDGIFLTGGTTGNLIQGNIIGLAIEGTNAVPNLYNGIATSGSTSNAIGGNTPATRNIISGNRLSGVAILQTNDAFHIVSGNFIGTDITGQKAISNWINGIRILGNTNTIGGTKAGQRNIISGNGQDGIWLAGFNRSCIGNIVIGNYIGLDQGGSGILSNIWAGVKITGAGTNQVGGTSPSLRNVISGNGNNGIVIQSGASGNQILGNYIGTDSSGTLARGNIDDGIYIESAFGNEIGGSSAGAGNLISGNNANPNTGGNNGIYLLTAAWNIVQGNRIGTDANGTYSIANSWNGIYLENSHSNQIGGTIPSTGNLISGNGRNGINFLNSSRNISQGNYVGLNNLGTSAVPNTTHGIVLDGSTDNTIGGQAPQSGNIVSGNGSSAGYCGLYLTNSSKNTVQGNIIGLANNLVSPIGNSGHGILLYTSSTNNIVGGISPGYGNIIANAKTAYTGVRVLTNAFNNLIRGNSIFNNGGLGIEIGNTGTNSIIHLQSGVTATDANRLQNYPVLTNAISSATGTLVKGWLDSALSKTYTLEFFASPTADPSGNGEGQMFLGQANVSITSICPTNFAVTIPGTVPAGWVVSATATDPANNTSEFSRAVPFISLPNLQINTNAVVGKMSLTWTNNGGNFSLVQATNLNPPVLWLPAGIAPGLSNGWFNATISTTNKAVFYRLSAQ